MPWDIILIRVSIRSSFKDTGPNDITNPRKKVSDSAINDMGTKLTFSVHVADLGSSFSPVTTVEFELLSEKTQLSNRKDAIRGRLRKENAIRTKNPLHVPSEKSGATCSFPKPKFRKVSR
jgi:hypothetical protein